MQEPVLQLENICFYYGQHVVLDHIDLAVMRGDFLGIVGPNGSGKSTLLKIMLGLLQPACGRVRLFGYDRSHFKQYTRVGYVAQNATSFNHGFPATVTEIVMSGLTATMSAWKRPGKKEKAQVSHALAQVGVEDLQECSVGELSGGQQQRVFIARALVAKPELLILDEPTVGVDLHAQEQFYALLSFLRQEQGLTLLMVSHDIGVVSEHVTSIACLNKQLYFHGTPADFWAKNTLEQVYGPTARVLHHAH